MLTILLISLAVGGMSVTLLIVLYLEVGIMLEGKNKHDKLPISKYDKVPVAIDDLRVGKKYLIISFNIITMGVFTIKSIVFDMHKHRVDTITLINGDGNSVEFRRATTMSLEFFELIPIEGAVTKIARSGKVNISNKVLDPDSLVESFGSIGLKTTILFTNNDDFCPSDKQSAILDSIADKCYTAFMNEFITQVYNANVESEVKNE